MYMKHGSGRALPLTVSVSILVLAVASPVAAHSGEGISIDHVIIEIGTWALAVVGVIAAIVAVFWVRARASRS
jgi:hypothetical protein